MRHPWETGYPTGGGRPAADDSLRASDGERNAVADRLSHHYADGRLDEAEFKKRLDTAMGATTRGDLRGLFDDLPPLVTDHPSPPPSRRRRVVPLLFVVAFVVIATGLTIPYVHVPWLLIVLVGVFFWYRGGHHHHRRGDPVVH
jgi:uncharacterized protein DUF1707